MSLDHPNTKAPDPTNVLTQHISRILEWVTDSFLVLDRQWHIMYAARAVKIR